jgi:hypothetical protein
LARASSSQGEWVESHLLQPSAFVAPLRRKKEALQNCIPGELGLLSMDLQPMELPSPEPAPAPAPVPALKPSVTTERTATTPRASVAAAAAGVECAICLDTVRSPRRFPNPECSHVYCAACLATLRGRSSASGVSCPQCRRPVVAAGDALGDGRGAAVRPPPLLTRPALSARELGERRRRTARTRLLAGAVCTPSPRPERALVTRTGAKYHLSRSCTGLRNAARIWEGSTEGKEACAICCAALGGDTAGVRLPAAFAMHGTHRRPDRATEVHFVTRTGQKFHRSRDCSGLRRATAVTEVRDATPTGGQLQPCELCCGGVGVGGGVGS